MIANEEDAISDYYLKYLTLAAPPSSQAAHYLARTVILRFGSLLEGQHKNVGLETLEDALKTSALGALSANLDARRNSKKASFLHENKRPVYGHNSSSCLWPKKRDLLVSINRHSIMDKNNSNFLWETSQNNRKFCLVALL
jgi:hypothetical protein